MKTNTEKLVAIKEKIYSLDLGGAIRLFDDFLKTRDTFSAEGNYDDICENYRLMLNFYVKGFNDPHRSDIYLQLLQRLYALIQNTYREEVVLKRSTFYQATQQSQKFDASFDNIKFELEDFVSSQAMLSISSEKIDDKKLFIKHQGFMNNLFYFLLSSPQWTDSEGHFYEELLLSPTIDINDILLLVTAITLSNIEVFDIHKFTVLINVYRHSFDEKVKQRALVGWCLSINDIVDRLYPEVKNAIVEICKNDQQCKEILELQIQVMLCLKTEADTEKIRKDIMPDLMKGQSFSISRSGIITEKDEDTLKEILHPEETEKTMERLESNMKRMMDMQKAGSDIYFGGFSQMKRFPFFYDLSNWFCPFYLQHPGLNQVDADIECEQFFNNLLKSGPFCDSDKYSFALSVEAIINRLPQNMRSLLNNEFAFTGGIADSDKNDAAYIRRFYLQDLYRFYKLYPNINDFKRLFNQSTDSSNLLFLNLFPMESAVIFKSFGNFSRFLYQQKMYRELDNFVSKVKDDASYHNLWLLYKGIAAYYRGDNKEAIALLKQRIDGKDAPEMVLRFYAKVCMKENDNQEAEQAYKKLLTVDKSNKSYLMNYCILLNKSHRSDEALNLAYKLNYDAPDDLNTYRILAWTLLNAGRFEEATNVYQRLFTKNTAIKEDFLNYGYALWLNNKKEEALKQFNSFIDIAEYKSDDFLNEIEKDKEMLIYLGLKEIDVQLMKDVVLSKM